MKITGPGTQSQAPGPVLSKYKFRINVDTGKITYNH